MKKALTLLFVAATLAGANAQNVDLLSLGSNSFPIDPGSSLVPSQTTTNLTMNSTVATGATFYNGTPFTPVSSFDWTGFTNFGIKMTLLGGAPTALGFDVAFFDDTFTAIDTYSASTAVLTTIGSEVSVDFTGISAPGTGIYGNVQYMQFTWGGDGAVNYSASTIYGVVPEPSSYALLALSGLAFGSFVVRRRQRR